MSLLRKVLWPSALALGFLVFLGAIGQSGVKVAQAAAGDFCAIEGPYIEDIGKARSYMLVGEKALVVGRIENNTGRVTEFQAELDNDTGDADITSIVRVSDSRYQYRDIRAVDEVSRVPVVELSNAGRFADIQRSNTLALNVEDLLEMLEDRYGYEAIGDVCGSDTIEELMADAIDAACELEGSTCFDEDAWDELFDDKDITVRELAAVIAAAVKGGELECDDIAEIVDREIISLSNDDEDAIVDDIFDLCAGEATEDRSEDILDTWWDDFAFIDVTCNRAGTFDLTFWHDHRSSGASTATQRSIQIECRGEPARGSTIDVRPSRVEIIPAMGNVSHALVTVELLDEDGEAAGLGFEVDFTTNICSIEVSGVDTAAEFSAANSVFRAYSANVAASAQAVQDSAAAKAAVDSTRQADTVTAFDNGGDTIAAAILGCGPEDTGTVATPGTATVTAVIEVLDGQDIILTKTVTVVGPPADLKVSASPSTLRCGEKATITATVKDSIGQNVSDHTRVEAVTNAGGVLGGTGAVAGGAGPVVPVASTVAETFDGVATFYLLTSESHAGPYEVVVTTGGAGSVTSSLGGVFSTRPEVAQQTVTCTIPTPVPAPQPTVSAPRTGTGSITPPSTGDAGLLASESASSSWTLFAAIGAVAFAVAGLVTLKFARR